MMIDPVSIATAAAAAAQALFFAADACRTFIEATRDIDHSVKTLESLSRGLAGVLQSLHQTLDDPILNSPRNAALWPSVQNSVKSCEATIAELETKLAPLRETGSNVAQQAWRALRLGREQPQIDRIISNLKTHSINLQLALQTANFIVTASVPGAVKTNQTARFDRLERMIVALRSHISPVDDSTQLEAVDDGLRAVAVDRDTKRLYWSASSIVTGSMSGTIRSVATDIPVESPRKQEPAFKDFSAISDVDPPVMGSEAGCSLDDDHRAQIHNWLDGSPVAQPIENGDIEEIAGSDEDSDDDDLGSELVASLFKRGMDCYAGEQFGEAREWLQRGIVQAGALSVEKQDELNVQSMQFHHALCCVGQSCLPEAESSFRLVTRGAGSRKEDARLGCLAHYHLARVQLRLGKLDSAKGQCKKAVQRMKNEISIGKDHPDYHNSLRLLALIVWANGSEYEAQAYSDQLPESQRIDKHKFDEELASMRGARSSENTLHESHDNTSGHTAISDVPADKETLHTQTSSSLSQSFELVRPISVDSTAKEMMTATVDVVSTVKTRHSSARTNRSSASVDSSSTAVQFIMSKGFLKKGGLNKGIHLAAKDGLLDVLEILLQQPSANVDTPRSSILSADKTPLQTAAARGHYKICKRLLEASATVNLMIDGQTALDSAIENGHMDVCRLILKHGAKVEPMLGQKMSILARAVHSDRLTICQLLLDHGADINDSDFKMTKLQRTGLMLAAARNNVRITTWLLDRGANVDGPEPGISTPLVEAARVNAIEACRILLEHNATKFLKSGKGTAVEAASGWLKKYIREWPASRSWKPPEGTNSSTVMRDPLGVNRQG